MNHVCHTVNELPDELPMDGCSLPWQRRHCESMRYGKQGIVIGYPYDTPLCGTHLWSQGDGALPYHALQV